jgi:hypothetical protein
MIAAITDSKYFFSQFHIESNIAKYGMFGKLFLGVSMTEDEVTARLKKLQIALWNEKPGCSLKEFYDYVIKNVPTEDWEPMLAAMQPENSQRWKDRLYRHKLEHVSEQELVDLAKEKGPIEIIEIDDSK